MDKVTIGVLIAVTILTIGFLILILVLLLVNPKTLKMPLKKILYRK